MDKLVHFLEIGGRVFPCDIELDEMGFQGLALRKDAKKVNRD